MKGLFGFLSVTVVVAGVLVGIYMFQNQEKTVSIEIPQLPEMEISQSFTE